MISGLLPELFCQWEEIINISTLVYAYYTCTLDWMCIVLWPLKVGREVTFDTRKKL